MNINVPWKVGAAVIGWVVLFLFGGYYGGLVLSNQLGPNDPLLIEFWFASVLLPIILSGIIVEWIWIRRDIAKKKFRA